MIKVLGYLKKIKSTAIMAMVFVCLAQLTTLLLPYLMSLLINNGIGNTDMDYIKTIGIAMICASAGNIVVCGFSSYFTSKTATDFSKIVRRDVFVNVESLSQMDIEKIGTPSLITRCTNDIKVMQDFILQSLRMIISAPIMLLGGSIMAFFLDPGLSVIIFAIFPVVGIILIIVVKTVLPLFKKRQLLTDDMNRTVREKLAGIRVIKAFNTSDYEDERFEVKSKNLSDIVLKFTRIMAVLLPICLMLVISGLVALILIASNDIEALDYIADAVEISTAIGDLQAFVIYMIMIIFAVTMAAAMFVIVPRAKISAVRIAEVLELENSIKEPKNPETISGTKKGEVEFKNVCFGYPDAQKDVLENISFTAKSGEVTAIIGGTGSGKSTIVNLIPRFYDVTAGQILFDGVDVRNLAGDDLHSRIGFVLQKACLFSGTIKDNLLFADENASDERLEKALEIAQCSEFVNSLEDGLNARVSQNATTFSGGQKQRLSIARALSRDAEVFIFDDSFSALDFKTDLKLRTAIRQNIDATVIIVAQRVGTIIDADKIIVLDEGKMVGSGTHKELLETCSVYSEIVRSQLSREDIA